MPDRDEQAHLHNEENRAEFAIRKSKAQLAAEERRLELEMEEFEKAEEQTKRRIEGEWRREHQGHEPERPPAWRKDPDSSGPPPDSEPGGA